MPDLRKQIIDLIGEETVCELNELNEDNKYVDRWMLKVADKEAAAKLILAYPGVDWAEDSV